MTPGDIPPVFLGMGKKNLTYVVSCKWNGVGQSGSYDGMTELEVRANDPYTALNKAEKSIVPSRSNLLESIAYVISIAGSVTKRVMIHPAPKCIDLVGHARKDHIWDNVNNPWYHKPKPKEDIKCMRCGMTHVIHRYGSNLSKERHEYIRGKPAMVSLNIHGDATYGVRDIIMEAVREQLPKALASKAAETPSVRSHLWAEYSSYASRILSVSPGASTTIWLKGWKDIRIPIHVGGIAIGANRNLYCHTCGWRLWSGRFEEDQEDWYRGPLGVGLPCHNDMLHGMDSHKNRNKFRFGSKSPAESNGCGCDYRPEYCTVCGEENHSDEKCNKYNTDTYWSDLCPDCEDRIDGKHTSPR